VLVTITLALSGERLIEAMPDLDRFLSEDDVASFSHIRLPTLDVPRGAADIAGTLEDADAFGAIVTEGMLMQRLTLAGQRGLRLLAPGDVIIRAGTAPADLLEPSSYEATSATQLALFDDKLVLATHHCPRVLAGLLLYAEARSHRLATQLMICQLQRVEDRVLAMLWLLADRFGRVTREGTLVGPRLTHQALGELVGARRPTVTLALKQLSDRGALRRRKDGWLLLERLAAQAGPASPGARSER